MLQHGKEDDVQFQKIEPPDLDQVAVVAQCLDNQWVPRTMLRDMVAKGLSLEDISVERAQLVRAEYLRSLLTAKQVIVNRAFLYNNHAIVRDYADVGPSRSAFIRLLRGRAIVPYLYKEETPTQQTAGVQVVPDGFDAWTRVCQDAGEMSCLRLSWQPSRNNDLTQKLGLSFHDFAVTASARAMKGGGAEFARHLAFPDDHTV